MAPRLGLGLGRSRLEYVCWHNKYSAAFDGVNDHMTFDSGINSILDVEVGTLSVWVKLQATGGNTCIFKASVNSNNNLELAYINSSQKIRYKYKAGGTNKFVDNAFAYEGNDTWYHLAMTWDTEADEFKAYLGSGQVGTTVGSLGTWSGSISAVKVGINTLADNQYWAGSIDNLALFNNVQDIDKLYNNNKPADVTTFPGLVGNWRFEEGTGTSTADKTGNKNTGHLINGAAFAADIP